MTLEADFDEDGIGNAGYFPTAVLIKDKDRLSALYGNVRDALLDIQVIDIDTFLRQHHSTEWRCQKCGYFIETLDTKDKIADYLFSFAAKFFKPCYKCRTHNTFTIQQGNIAFRLEKKESHELPEEISLDLKR